MDWVKQAQLLETYTMQLDMSKKNLNNIMNLLAYDKEQLQLTKAAVSSLTKNLRTMRSGLVVSLDEWVNINFELKFAEQTLGILDGKVSQSNKSCKSAQTDIDWLETQIKRINSNVNSMGKVIPFRSSK